MAESHTVTLQLSQVREFIDSGTPIEELDSVLEEAAGQVDEGKSATITIKIEKD